MDGSILWMCGGWSVVLGLEACLRQPDRNDDATTLAALARGRDQRHSPDFFSRVFPSPIQERAVLLIVVINEFREQAFEMPFTHRNYLVQYISSGAFDPTLRYAVLPRASKGGPYGSILRDRTLSNFQPVLCIPIEDQKPECRLKRKRLPQLLDNSLARGVPCDVEVQNTPTIIC